MSQIFHYESGIGAGRGFPSSPARIFRTANKAICSRASTVALAICGNIAECKMSEEKVHFSYNYTNLLKFGNCSNLWSVGIGSGVQTSSPAAAIFPVVKAS